MNKKTILLAIAGFLCFGLNAQTAPKYGHLNSGNLLSLLPEVASADVSLDSYQKILNAKGDSMVAVLKSTYDIYMKQNSEGSLNQNQVKQKEQELQGMQAKLQEYDNDIKQKMMVKRQELLDPVLKRVDEAIKAVGKEGGYSMIFDESTGAMMFSQVTADVGPLVKKKLGL